MRHVTVRFKLITPAYLGGADPQIEPAELRAPAFRGLLRYWLRAAAGSTYPDSAHVRTIEDATFGSVNSGSPISLWVSDETPPAQPASINRGGPVRAQSPLSLEQRYLFWSMDRRRAPSKALPAGTQFDLHLALRGGADTAGQPFGRAIGALWLLAHLGAVGGRSRRGAGSLSPVRITGMPDELAYLSFAPPTSAEELQQRLQAGILAVRALYPSAPATLPTLHPYPAPQLPAFDVLARDTCRLWILRAPTGVWSSPDDVLNALGASLRDYRRSIPRLADRTVFGLPLIARNGGQSIPGRRASPLVLRVSSVSSRAGIPEYVAVAVLFKAQFQPIANRGSHGSPDYQLVEGWARSTSFKAIEVPL